MKKIFLIIAAIANFDSFAVTEPTPMAEQICSPVLIKTFDYIGEFEEIFPPLLMFGVTKTVMEDACPNETDAKLASIQSSLDSLSERTYTLEQNMTVMGYDIKVAMETIFSTNSDQILSTLQDQIFNFTGNVRDYKLVFPSSFNSLADFTNKSGGFMKLYEENDKYKNLFLTGIPQQIDNLKIMLKNHLKALQDGLEGMCRNSEAITGNVIGKREHCNTIALYVETNIISQASQARKMLIDEINTVIEGLNSGKITKSYLESKGLKDFYTYRAEENKPPITWEKAAEFVNNMVDDKIIGITNALLGDKDSNKKFIQPLDGFQSELEYYMKANYCPFFSKPEDFRLRISEWYSNIHDGQPPYIVTSCSNHSYGNTVDSRIIAKYYLDGGNKVNNILGVLIPVDAISKKTSPIEIAIGNPTTFKLTSDLPLDINSKTIPHYLEPKYNVIQQPKLSFVPEKTFGPISPVYSYNSSFLSIATIANGAYLSSFLEPMVDSKGKNSKTEFVSMVYSSYYDPILLGKGPVLNATIYLSFKKENGFTYVFGLEIFNIGAAKERIKSPEGSYSVNIKAKQTVSLVCFTETQCTTSGNEIVWKDDTYASISGGGNDIRLSFGTKLKASK